MWAQLNCKTNIASFSAVCVSLIPPPRRLNVHFSKAMSTCYYLLLYYYEEYSRRRVALWRVLTPKMGHQPRWCWRGDMSKWSVVMDSKILPSWTTTELVKQEKGELHDWLSDQQTITCNFPIENHSFPLQLSSNSFNCSYGIVIAYFNRSNGGG